MIRHIIRLLLLLSSPCFGFAQDFRLEKLPAFINSPDYDEITPVPGKDGRTLFFTRTGYPVFERKLLLDSFDILTQYPADQYINILSRHYSQLAGKPIAEPLRSFLNQDIWLAKGDSSGVFQQLVHPGYPLNNAQPNSLVANTPDPNAFYVMNQFTKRGDIDRGFSVVRRLSDTLWAFPQPVSIKDYYTITSEVSLTMSFDGQILILGATRSDSRDMDLYVCFRQEGDNVWSAPQHLGNSINSEKRESTPFLSEDNETLFFSSNRSGNNDIYFSKRLDDTWKNWSTPERLVEPVNSDADDSQPFFNMSTGLLYFTSKRDGSSDIFRVQIAPPQPTEITVIGRVMNRKTRKVIRNATVYYSAANVPENSVDAINGTFRIQIPKGIRFYIKAEKPAYQPDSVDVYFRRDYYSFPEYFVDVWLDPMEVNQKIELRPIYFEQSKAVILEQSFPELSRLASVLLENPGMKIRVEGHTDNLGKVSELVRLSEERAMAIRDFLREKNIDPARIEVVGHGPKFPKSDNSSEAERSKNRRVEVIITKM